jgi:hypothetical protein
MEPPRWPCKQTTISSWAAQTTVQHPAAEPSPEAMRYATGSQFASAEVAGQLDGAEKRTLLSEAKRASVGGWLLEAAEHVQLAEVQWEVALAVTALQEPEGKKTRKAESEARLPAKACSCI